VWRPQRLCLSIPFLPTIQDGPPFFSSLCVLCVLCGEFFFHDALRALASGYLSREWYSAISPLASLSALHAHQLRGTWGTGEPNSCDHRDVRGRSCYNQWAVAACEVTLLTTFETAFPVGFGLMVQEIRTWRVQ